jgi:DNA polymerase III delta subunit
MIVFFHGSNQVLSRNKLKDLVSQAENDNQEIIYLNGLNINLESLKQNLESGSLFGQEKLVIIEKLFSRPKSKIKDQLVKYLKTEPISTSLIFWEPKSIAGTTTRWLPKNWHINEFKVSPVIFKFLDSLQPKNNKIMLELLHQCLEIDSQEMVFYMLARQIRSLLIAKDMGKKGLSGAPWQIGKLISQAKRHTLKELLSFYKKLLIADEQIKTGQSILPLSYHLDLIILQM